MQSTRLSMTNVIIVIMVGIFTTSMASECISGPCLPGNEFCGKPFANAPVYHLMSQHGCQENDPNGPVFDPVHGVIHHFYQIHLAAPPGHGPDYGHFVSKDFIHWAEMPVAIWNGLDVSFSPPRVTKYDNEAIFTGSAVVVDGAGPGGRGPGVVNIYPGLCNKNNWPACGTGTLLAIAIPADYSDVLLENWTKPSYNPIVENTQRDPSTPWKSPSGEWRLRTYDAKVYGSASDADFLAGRWYEIGKSDSFRTCECPSLYPLPEASPGTEQTYEQMSRQGSLPTHVHKTSCGGDWWQVGTYTEGKPKELGRFEPTEGWTDLFEQRKIDEGNFYASKDNVYPTLDGRTRRINWGWAQVPPASTQTLPRHITFNPTARCLQQYPLDELKALRQAAVIDSGPMPIHGAVRLATGGVSDRCEVVVSFRKPSTPTTFGISISTASATLSCAVEYSPNSNASASYYGVPVYCGASKDTLRLLPSETTIELRLFLDATFIEAYFQMGRVAVTKAVPLRNDTSIDLTATAPIAAVAVQVFPLRSIWTTPDAVRAAARVYH